MKALIKSLISDTNPLLLWYHRSKVLVAAARYGFPARDLTVIGITGTDGKTTTVGMIAHILNENGIKAGALSTAFFQVGKDVEWNATQKTSPSPFVVQKFLRKLADAGCTHAVLEYSSHGLLQGRNWLTWPTVAGITNLSEEHLDYHGTMEKYLDAKSILFRMVRKGGTKVLHTSDRSYAKLSTIRTYREGVRTFSYNAEPTNGPESDKFGPSEDFWLTDAHRERTGETATLHWKSQAPMMHLEFRLALGVMGAFNLENALCAIACCKALESPPPLEKIVSSLATFKGIPGRMELIDEGQPFAVIVDFTVTPQSYEKTLSTIKAGMKPGQRLLVLTGSCGDRMKEKRPVVGKIVSSYADVMVVANEDPYTEDPENIIDEVWAGIDQSKTKAHRIFDRKEAIAFLLKEAKPDDVVVLCGKGSDTTMWVKTGQIPWNERQITRELLKSMN